MKNFSRIMLGVLLLTLAITTNANAAKKLVSNGTLKTSILYISNTNYSPYLPVKTIQTDDEWVVGYQIYYLSIPYEGSNYEIDLRLGTWVNGILTMTDAPVDVTIYGSVTSTGYTGPVSKTILEGTDYVSAYTYSTYEPTVTLSSTSPNEIGGYPVVIGN